MSSCVSSIHAEYKQDQAVAICYSKWRDKTKKASLLVITPYDEYATFDDETE